MEVNMTPKVFISYSWTSQSHQELVKEWADRLLADGVDVILDIYDLKEGQDKFAFMEKMVTDPDVTHVLVICDKGYAEKADAREKGVGTESQIISTEVYEKVDQSKFIPVVCEFISDGTPYLPTFLKSRIWIDFSSPEAVNAHWERLVRLLYGKPQHEKPKVGKIPAYVAEDSAIPSSPARAKFISLRQAILTGKPGIGMYRREFIDSCIDFADALRVRERPDVENLGKKILEDCGKLVPIRDLIIDWVLVDAEASPSGEFSEALIDMLERLRELKSRPPELNQWNEAWFEAHSLFVYEVFLYVVAALLKARAFEALHNIFTSHYLLPSTERYGDKRFERFDGFYAFSDTLNPVLAPEGQRLYSPAAELLKRQASREDLPFADIIQADLLILLMAFITPDARWYPQLMYYSRYGNEFPFFIRASQHKNFKNLAVITGYDDADALRKACREGHKRMDVERWHKFSLSRNFWSSMNMDKLDTEK
jgi:hypothetical protein